MRDYFKMFAQYNQWANTRLYDAAALLSDADYRAPRGAFFGSLHGTLNHLVIGDRVWLARLDGDSPGPTALDTILEDTLPALRRLRDAEDQRFIALMEGLTEARLTAPFSYRTMSGAPVAQPLGTALAHIFNHQAHHRGQAHALLTAAGGRAAAPSFDLIQFQRETEIGLS